MSALLKNAKIDNVIAKRDAYSRAAAARFENAEGQICQRKMGISCDLNERTKRHFLFVFRQVLAFLVMIENIGESAQIFARLVEAAAAE